MTTPTGEDLDRGYGAWQVTPTEYLQRHPPGFDGMRRNSCYVAVRDGTRIAVDVHLPDGGGDDMRLPTIVLFTPYYRRFALRPGHRDGVEVSPNAAQFRDAFVPHGYAVVVVDVRGTGASFGWRDGFRSPKERFDYYDVVDWITAQSWSDGAVGATGISYVGAAADFLASTRHPAVKAIIPTFSVWDTWSNHLYPGGLQLSVVPQHYGDLCRAMDLDDREAVQRAAYFADPDFAGPAPVDGDDDGAELAQAIAEHEANVDMVAFANGMAFRDSAVPGSPNYSSATISPYAYAKRENDAATAVMSVTGWMDGGGYSTGSVQRFLWQQNPAKRLLIGPWDHGARTHVSPWRRDPTLAFQQLGEYLRFFDHHLKGADTGLDAERPVHFFTMGLEAWQATDTWPPPAATATDLFLAADGALSFDAPSGEEATDLYDGDLSIGSGRDTRYERLYFVVAEEYYRDWPGRDAKMLTYTGHELEDDCEVTGHPVAHLHLASSEPDGGLFVYLEDVASDGTCRYVTEGVFRLAHRGIGDPPKTIPATGPTHSFTEADLSPLVPGEPAEISFELLPTSYLFRKRHRMRIAIAAADADHFHDLPNERPPRLTFYRGRNRPSRVTLPIVSGKRP